MDLRPRRHGLPADINNPQCAYVYVCVCVCMCVYVCVCVCVCVCMCMSMCMLRGNADLEVGGTDYGRSRLRDRAPIACQAGAACLSGHVSRHSRGGSAIANQHD